MPTIPRPHWKVPPPPKPWWQRLVLGFFEALSMFGGGQALGIAQLPQIIRPLYYRMRMNDVATAATLPATTEAALDATSSAIPESQSYTVIAGDSLWKIAKDSYGNGQRWIDIWRLNRAKIAEADLIFPGQVFAIPGIELHRESGTRPGVSLKDVTPQMQAVKDTKTPQALKETGTGKTAGTVTQAASTGTVSKDTQALKNNIQPQIDALNRSLGELAANVDQYAKDTKNKIAAEARTEASNHITAYATEAKKFTTAVASASSKMATVDAVVNLLDVARDTTATVSQMAQSGQSATTASSYPGGVYQTSTGAPMATNTGAQTAAPLAQAQTTAHAQTGTQATAASASAAAPVTVASTVAANAAGQTSGVTSLATGPIVIAPAAIVAMQTSVLSQTVGEQVATAGVEQTYAMAVQQENSSAPSTSGATGAPAGMSLSESNPTGAATLGNIAGHLGVQALAALIGLAVPGFGAFPAITAEAIQSDLTAQGRDPSTGIPSSTAPAISPSVIGAMAVTTAMNTIGVTAESGVNSASANTAAGYASGAAVNAANAGEVAIAQGNIEGAVSSIFGGLVAASAAHSASPDSAAAKTAIQAMGPVLSLASQNLDVAVALHAKGIDLELTTNLLVTVIMPEIIATNLQANPTANQSLGLGNLSAIGVTGSGLQGIDAAAAASLSSGIGIGGAGSIGYSGTIASVANALGITQTSLIGQLAQAGKISPEQAGRLMGQVTDDPTPTPEDVEDAGLGQGMSDAAATAAAAAAVSEAATAQGLGVGEAAPGDAGTSGPSSSGPSSSGPSSGGGEGGQAP